MVRVKRVIIPHKGRGPSFAMSLTELSLQHEKLSIQDIWQLLRQNHQNHYRKTNYSALVIYCFLKRKKCPRNWHMAMILCVYLHNKNCNRTCLKTQCRTMMLVGVAGLLIHANSTQGQWSICQFSEINSKPMCAWNCAVLSPWTHPLILILS